MSILIRDMEMPQNCLGCPLTWVDDDYNSVCPFTNVVALNIGRQYDCPLIELPPHGRLIDADELKSKFRHSNGDDDADSAWISTIRRFITQADTIIEAEGSEKDA